MVVLSLYRVPNFEKTVFGAIAYIRLFSSFYLLKYLNYNCVIVFQFGHTISKRNLVERHVLLSCLRWSLNYRELVSRKAANTVKKSKATKTARYYSFTYLLFICFEIVSGNLNVYVVKFSIVMDKTPSLFVFRTWFCVVTFEKTNIP